MAQHSPLHLRRSHRKGAKLLIIVYPSISDASSLSEEIKDVDGTAEPLNYESSFWLKNACRNGFVVVKDKRVLAQHEGLNKHDQDGK